MVIVSDTRQQAGKHNTKEMWWDSHNYHLIRSKVPFGDYCLPPKVAVDTKMSMGEIAQNIGGSAAEHARFKRELLLAKECGSHLYILVENTDGIRRLSEVQYWDNPRLKDSPKAITGLRLCKAMDTMQQRYGVTFLFCRPEESAEVIVKLLERNE